MRHAFLVVALLLAAAPAAALEGRTQISSAPYTISAPGSYVLTNNLSVGSNTHAIAVTADFVTIDLNGFAIQGPNTCSFASGGVTCAGSGSGRGISAVSRQGITVRNGAIRGTGAEGILTGISARIENVTVSDAGADGIDVGNGSIVRGSSVERVDFAGIRCQTGCLLVENRVREAGTNGLEGGNSIYRGNVSLTVGVDGIAGVTTVGGSLFESNVARGSGDDGLTAIGGFAFFDNTATTSAETAGTLGAGIDTLSEGIVIGNTIAGSLNGGFGYESTGRALVMENTITGNASYGIHMVAGNACYGRNVLSLNPAGGAQTSGNAIQNDYNSCGRDLTCP